MDVVFFLKLRTKFLRFLYDESSKPFVGIKKKIETKTAPYNPPPFDPEYDSEEPPFLEEWLEADSALHVLGMSCVSLLSDTLKIYFKTLEHEYGFELIKSSKKHPRGFVGLYQDALGQILDTNWNDCPVNFDLIEQIVIARNQGQHGKYISSILTEHDPQIFERFSNPLFISDQERALLSNKETEGYDFLYPYMDISRENLFLAIEEVEKLADWIAANENRFREWRKNAKPS